MRRREFIAGLGSAAAWSKALGLTFPTTLLGRADAVIE
jgi:hypothetical protein